MSESTDNAFDAGAYWQDRVVSGADLSVVGHRSMGHEYNRHIYERRLEVLDEMLARHSGKPVADLRVLDIGCGSGFYTGYWAAQGVRDALVEGGVIENIQEAAAQIREITTRLRDGKGTLGRLLSEDDTLYEDLGATVASLKEVAGRLERVEEGEMPVQEREVAGRRPDDIAHLGCNACR